MAVTNNAANNSVLNNFQTIESQTTTTSGAQLVMVKNRALGAIQSGDTVGTMQFVGNDGSTNIISSQINSVCSGTVAANRVPSDLEFYTHPDSITASTLRMTIGNAGNVTIIAPDSGTALVIQAGGETISAGDLTLSDGNILMSRTTTAGDSGEIRFNNVRFVSAYPDETHNTFVGGNSGNTTMTGLDNHGFGATSLQSLTTSPNNCAMGSGSLSSLAGGTTGGNTSIGHGSGNHLINGDDNVFLGATAGSNYTGSESQNICIGSGQGGIVGDNNTMRLGNPGSISKCFVGGIASINVGSVATVVSIATGTSQLGTTTITAGTGVTITPGAGTITISAGTGAQVVTIVSISDLDSPYTVLSTDYFISVDCRTGTVSVLLPNAPTTGRIFAVKDSFGASFTNNISVTTVGGVVLIDGSTTYTMNTNFSAISLIFNGSSYEIY